MWRRRPRLCLEDADVVASKFVRRDAYGAFENYLGMEHPDKNPRKTAQQNNTNNRYGAYDQKAIKIYS